MDINTEANNVASTNTAELQPNPNGELVPDIVFEEEREKWKGYIEWEDYPEKKEQAAAKFARFKFPPPPEFQLGPLPQTNPVLEGIRWKLWHRAIGGPLTKVPEESWEVVLRASNATICP